MILDVKRLAQRRQGVFHLQVRALGNNAVLRRAHAQIRAAAALVGRPKHDAVVGVIPGKPVLHSAFNVKRLPHQWVGDEGDFIRVSRFKIRAGVEAAAGVMR